MMMATPFFFACQEWTAGNCSQSPRITNRMHYKGSAVSLKKRRLSEKTYGEVQDLQKKEDFYAFYYHNKNGQPVGAKVRTTDKQFTWEGESDGSFFGQHLWKGKGKQIIVTEGELDAATYAELYPSWDVVSPPSGAAGAKKAVQKNYEFLQGYDSIILWFDNDEAGQKAAHSDAAGVLPPGKTYIARIEACKDLSDAHQDNNRKAIDEAFWAKKLYRPDGIIEGKSSRSNHNTTTT